MLDLDALAADGFGDWFAGFVDGEGCFLVYGGTAAKPEHSCRLVIEVRADERAVLEEIQSRLGIGKIQSLPKRRTPTSAPLLRWYVSSKSDCALLVTILDRFPLRAKKRADYEVWRRAVCVWLVSGRGNRNDERLAALKAELGAGRLYVAA